MSELDLGLLCCGVLVALSAWFWLLTERSAVEAGELLRECRENLDASDRILEEVAALSRPAPTEGERE